MKNSLSLPGYLLIALLCLASIGGFAQKHDSLPDSLAQVLRQAKINDSLHLKALSDTVVPKIVNKIESYSFTLSRSTNYFKRRIDTIKIAADLPALEKGLVFFKTRLDKNDQMNLRNLNTFTILLQESTDKLDEWQKNLDEYAEHIASNNLEVKKIIEDNTLKTNLPDTALTKQVQSVLKRARALDSMQRTALTRINIMKNKVSINSLLVGDMLSDLRFRTNAFKTAMWGREDKPLYKAGSANYKLSSWEVFTSTITRSGRVMAIYTALTWDTRSINLLILAALLLIFILNYRRIRKLDNAPTILAPLHFTKRSIVASTFVVFLCIGPFLYTNPPMVYMHTNEVLRLVLVTVLLFPYFTKQGKTGWFTMVALWAVFAMLDLFLEASFGERWWMFFASIISIVVCTRMLLRKTDMFQQIEESPLKRSIITVTLAFSALSLIFNILGKVTLAKIFGITAVQSFVFAFSLKVFSKVILEEVYLQAEAYRETKFSDFINYETLKIKLRRILWVITGILWLIAFCRSLTVYDIVSRFVDMFFNKQRSIGNMQFSFMSIAIFVFVIWIASIISQFINFFFGTRITGNTNKRNNIGSMMLLVRIAIWALGFLIAVAAAGIPLDKVSIMIGALGVGIGFGLQNIVNNLVSGIILAFERPIQIGDSIEVDNRSGIVKEIGVRSSKISSFNGSEIIIPNGDLLSKHLVNWTLHNRNKRLEIVVGIAYEADVRKAKELIEGILNKNEKVMQSPASLVSVNNFGESSIDFQVYFWTYDLADALTLRSDIMIEIVEAFNKAEIEIPYPKSDVFIKTATDNKKSNLLAGPGLSDGDKDDKDDDANDDDADD